jgi:hypothetical protein
LGFISCLGITRLYVVPFKWITINIVTSN